MFFSSCILPYFLKRKNANILVVWSMFCSQGFINTRGRLTPRKFWPSCFQSRVYAICPFLENGRCGVWQKVKVNFVQTDFVSSLMHPAIFCFVLSFPLSLSSIPRPMGPCFYSYKCVISTVFPAESCLRLHVDRVKANDLRGNDGVRIDKSIGHHTLLLSSSSSPPHTVAVVQLFLASNSHSLFKSPT